MFMFLHSYYNYDLMKTFQSHDSPVLVSFLRVELTINPDGFLTEKVFGGVEVNDWGAVPNQGA